MSTSIEAQGHTVDEAIQIALNQLGVSRDKVEIDILHHPRRGVLGIGARRAKVRATIRQTVMLDGEEFDMSGGANLEDKPRRRRRRGGRNRGGREEGAERPATPPRQGGQPQQPRGERREGQEREGGQSREGRGRGDEQRGRDDRRPGQGRAGQGGQGPRGGSQQQGRGPQQGGQRGPEQAGRGERQGESQRGEGRGDRGREGRRDRGDRQRDRQGGREQNDRRDQRQPRPESTQAEAAPSSPEPFATGVSVEAPAAYETPPPRRAPVEEVPLDAAALDAIRARAEELVRELLAKMGFTAEVSSSIDEEAGEAIVSVRSESEGLLIGRRGQTLDSLEHIVNRMTLKAEAYVEGRVLLDIGDYRKRRRESLDELAQRLRTRAIAERRTVQVSPMSPRDRKFFALAFAGDDAVEVRSLGAGFYRRVIVAPAGTTSAAAIAEAEAVVEMDDDTADTETFATGEAES